MAKGRWREPSHGARPGARLSLEHLHSAQGFRGARGRIPSSPGLSLATWRPAPDSATPQKAFTLEPYSYAEARALSEGLDLAEPVAVTLVRRGYRTVEEARAFLEAAEAHDPFEFDGMGEVTSGDRRRAIAAGRTITVHGDYDCDGVCSTAILVRTLRELGATLRLVHPGPARRRLRADHGGGGAARRPRHRRPADHRLRHHLRRRGRRGRRAGMEVIVTDHHEPGERLPDCPILHPRLGGYPCADLCATGVAYKLAAALLGPEGVERELDLVALATVADLVPLRGENRALVRAGLAVARRAGRPGLRALCAAAGVQPVRLDEGDLAFRLGPRINAAGRLYRADAGVELMLTESGDRAAAIAAELDSANRERRDAERDGRRRRRAGARRAAGRARRRAGAGAGGGGVAPGRGRDRRLAPRRAPLGARSS